MIIPTEQASVSSTAQLPTRWTNSRHTMTAHEEGQFDDCEDEVAKKMPSEPCKKEESDQRTHASCPSPVNLLSKNKQTPVPSSTESREERNSDAEHQVSAKGITKLDVLSGRGGGTNNHAGNKHFRQLCDQRRHVYVMSKKMIKREIAKEIVADVRARGGRFLKRDDKTGEWEDIGDQRAISKTSQALREGLAQKMRQALVTSGTAEQMRLAASVPSSNAYAMPDSMTAPDISYARSVGAPTYPVTDLGYNSPARIVSPDRVRKMPFSDHDAFKRQKFSYEPF